MTIKLPLLVAFPYLTAEVVEYLGQQDPATFCLIVDSGAFTAWNKGTEINLDDYMALLRSLPKSWDMHAVQLDVIGDPEGTYRNLQVMLDAGFNKIMPVFTRGDSLERLDEFYTLSDYIMLGGVAMGEGNTAYVKWFEEHNNGRSAHWLGFVRPEFVRAYRPTSVDSSSVNSSLRFGSIGLYAGHGNMRTVAKAKFRQHPGEDVVRMLSARGWGFDEIKKLGTLDAWHGRAREPHDTARGLAGFMHFCEHVYRSVDVQRNLGTRVHLALTTKQYVVSAFDAYNHLMARGII